MSRFNPSDSSGDRPKRIIGSDISSLRKATSPAEERLLKQNSDLRNDMSRLARENGNLRREQDRLSRENAELRSATESIRQEVNALKAEGNEQRQSDQYQRERQQEAKADYDQQVRPQLQTISLQVSTISDEQARDGCQTLILRIEQKVNLAQNTGTAADPALILDIFDDYTLLSARIEAAQAADESERKLLKTLGDRLKGHLAAELWSVLSKLGRLRQWTAEGEVSAGIFGVAKGSAKLGIMFERQ
jgi:chromosome segregation ATPase